MVDNALMLLRRGAIQSTMKKTNLVRRRRTYEMNKRSYPMKLIVWTCNHIARCNGHISWMRDGRKWRRFCMRCLWLMVIQMGSLLIFVRKPISISNLRLATKRRELETSIYSEKEYIHVSIIKTYTHFPNELCF